MNGEHTLTLVNPDGQKANCPFTPAPAQAIPPTNPPQPQQPDPHAPSGNGTTNTPAGGPTISNVTPNSGSSQGGTPVTISGTNFGTSAAAVAFGGTPAVSVTILSATTIIAQSPAHAAGVVDLMVQTAEGGTVTSAGGYTYVDDAQRSSGANNG